MNTSGRGNQISASKHECEINVRTLCNAEIEFPVGNRDADVSSDLETAAVLK